MHCRRQFGSAAISDGQGDVSCVEVPEAGVIAAPALAVPRLHPRVWTEYMGLAGETTRIGNAVDHPCRNSTRTCRRCQQERHFGAVATTRFESSCGAVVPTKVDRTVHVRTHGGAQSSHSLLNSAATSMTPRKCPDVAIVALHPRVCRTVSLQVGIVGRRLFPASSADVDHHDAIPLGGTLLSGLRDCVSLGVGECQPVADMPISRGFAQLIR